MGSPGENARARAVAAAVVAMLVSPVMAVAGAASPVGDGTRKPNVLPAPRRPSSSLPGRKDFESVRRTRPPGLRPRSVWATNMIGGAGRRVENG